PPTPPSFWWALSRSRSSLRTSTELHRARNCFAPQTESVMLSQLIAPPHHNVEHGTEVSIMRASAPRPPGQLPISADSRRRQRLLCDHQDIERLPRLG